MLRLLYNASGDDRQREQMSRSIEFSRAVTVTAEEARAEAGRAREPSLRESLEQVLGAAYDFARGYMEMREANTKGADAYFHCRVHCEGSARGPRRSAARES